MKTQIPVPPPNAAPPFPPEKLEFKNKGFRKMCVTAIVAGTIIAAVYILSEMIFHKQCQNYPRAIIRIIEVILFCIEMGLFANRMSLYLEFSGDYALARRSAVIMMAMLIISSVTEAYYISPFLADPNAIKARQIYMAIIIVIGTITVLPLLQFELFNIDIITMRVSAYIGIAASIVSFFIGSLIIGYSTIVTADVDGLFNIIARIIDSLAPVYLLQIFPCLILVYHSRILFIREIKRDNKFNPQGPDPELEKISGPDDYESKELEELEDV